MDNGQGVGIRLSNPMKRCRRKASVSFHRVRRDSRFSGARGAAPCTERSDAGPRIADAVSGRGGGSAGRTIHGRQTMYRSAPFVPKGFLPFPALLRFPSFFSAPLRERLKDTSGHSITTARKLCLQSRRHLRHSSL